MQVIGIQPLNIISPAEGECFVSGSRGTLVFLCEHAHAVRFELSRNRLRSIRGTVINDDDLLSIPRLRYRRVERVSDPLLGVKRRNKN